MFRTIDKQNSAFSITELSQKFKLSLSVVSHALKPLRDMNMVKIGKNESHVTDTEKLLFFWATRRDAQKEIIYETRSDLSTSEIEASMPADVVPTAYSLYKMKYKTLPADYDVVYFYAYDIKEIQKRFPPKKSHHQNIFILQPDLFLKTYKLPPTAQLFVDLWNAPQWYSRDFTNELLIKIKTQIGL